MKSQTFIFIGRSGSGKGTQAVLLRQYLSGIEFEESGGGKDFLEPKRMNDVLHVVTGDLMRAFAKEDNYTANLVRETLEKGLLMPDFFAVLMWGNYFVKNLKGKEHVITDGMPRKLHEAIMLLGAFKYYKRDKPIVIFLDISHDSAVNRLLKRGRADDTREVIEERLKFYENDVVPVIEYFKKSPDCTFLHIDGEPAIPAIFDDIKRRLNDLWAKEK